MRERLIDRVPREAVGAWLSHNTGFDMSTLPPRFTLRELNERIVAANASPVGFVPQLAQTLGDDGEITRDEFFEHGLADRDQLRHDGRPARRRRSPIISRSDSRAPAAAAASCCAIPRPSRSMLLHNIVDLLVPELQRRGRFRTAYTGRTLRENLAT